jgi:hypothetical protein
MGLLKKLWEGEPATRDQSPAELGLTPNGKDMVHVDVVGEASYQQQIRKVRDAVAQHQGQDPWFVVRFIAEPTNKHDPNAVKVVAWGKTVGYLPKAAAKRAQPRLAKTGGQQIGIAQLMGGTSDKPHFGVLAYAKKGTV